MTTHKIRCINSFSLHIIAMVLMFIDHLWGTIVQGNQWMTNLGRLAFPMFAFMLVEGFFHTKNMKKYFLRIGIGVLLSEIPFNLMMSGELIDPFEQSVMCTFLVALTCMLLAEKAIQKHPRLGYVIAVLTFLVGALVGTFLFVDYSGYGILMVGVFYFFRGNQWWKLLLQAAGLIYINMILFKGMIIDVTIFGYTFEMMQQGLAVFSLPIIWLYNGNRGPGGKPFQYFCYLFYPVHILILSLISIYV